MAFIITWYRDPLYNNIVSYNIDALNADVIGRMGQFCLNATQVYAMKVSITKNVLEDNTFVVRESHIWRVKDLNIVINMILI